jgi:hypothetical protein
VLVLSPPNDERRLLSTGSYGSIFGASLTLIGPSDVIIDRSEYGRSTAAQLMSYFDLEDNWDCEGALKPHPEAIADALRMLEVTPIDVSAPKPMALAAGDVALYWDMGETYAEIGFDGSGTYYAYARSPNLAPVYLDDIPLYSADDQSEFPSAVFEVLTSQPSAT